MANNNNGNTTTTKIGQAMITILTDLDGTVLPRPYSEPGSTVVHHPNLSAGPCHQPLVRLLDLGATVVGVTGSQLSTHQTRFLDDLPLRHRQRGQVLLAVQTGSHLYRTCPKEGLPIRCEDFASHLSKSVAIRLDDSVVRELITIGKQGLQEFYSDLLRDPTLVDPHGPLGYLHGVAKQFPKEQPIHIPVTDDHQTVPRIEVRAQNSAVVFVGIPSSIGDRYLSIPPHLQSQVDGRPTGRSCFDCVPAGLNKSHIVQYLIEQNLAQANQTIAIGDQPRGNDKGLTQWHDCPHHTIPFVSVSEQIHMVPDHLQDWHVSQPTNAEGSAEFFKELANLLEQRILLQQQEEEKTENIRLNLDANLIRELVEKVNGHHARN